MGLQARSVGTAAALLALAALAAPVASEARVLKQQPVEPAVTTETNWYQGDQQLTLVTLGAYKEAVCNDGTPAAFYYSAGSDPNNWLLYLEGGACSTRRRVLNTRCHLRRLLLVRWARPDPPACRAPPGQASGV